MSGRPNITIDKSQLVQLLTWFLFIVSVFGVCARIWTKHVMNRWTLRRDDKIILIAQTAFLTETICVSLAASFGLGKPMSTLTEKATSNILKAEYASVPLLILTLTLVKWSISSFIYQLSRHTIHHRINASIMGIVGLWAVTSMAISLSQCRAPTPWDYIHGRHCIDRRAWWTFVGVLNIATELCFIVQYFLAFWNLQLPRLKRTILVSVFSTRILVVAAIIAQLHLFRDTYSLPDATFNAWLPAALNQIVGSLSITTACIPYLKPFMQSLEAEIIRVDSMSDAREETIRGYSTSHGTGYNLTEYSTFSANCSVSR